MNHLRRTLSFIMALAVLILSLTACAPQKPNDEVESPSTVTTPEESVTTSDDVAAEATATTPEVTATEPTTTEATTTTTEATTTVATTTEATTTTTEATTVTTTEATVAVEDISGEVYMYAKSSVNVREKPDANSERVGGLSEGEKVQVTGKAANGWYRIKFDGGEYFVSGNYLTEDAPKPADGIYTVSGSFSSEFLDNEWDTYCKPNSVTGDVESCWGTHYPDITSVIESAVPLEYITSIEITLTASNIDTCWNGKKPHCELHFNSRGDGAAEATVEFDSKTVKMSCDIPDGTYAIILNPYAFSSSVGAVKFDYTVTITCGEYQPENTSPDNDNDNDKDDDKEIETLAAQLYGTDYEYKKSELSAMKKATTSYDASAPSLYEAFSDYFNVGACINSWYLNSTSSEDFKSMMKQYNTFTLENESKPDAMHPSENKYNFTSVDKFVDFGEKYGVTLRGHTLIWHSQCPDWFFYKSGTSGTAATAKQLLDRIDEHVTTIVSRYAGKIDTWDVVNEVFNDDGTLRDSKWLQIVGDYDKDGDKYDYIEAAFKAAAAADPNARLIINDYNLEWSTAKTQGVYNLVKSMLEDGIKVDGVGLQMHIAYNTDINQLRKNLEILEGLRKYNPDFTIEITEMDMSCFVWSDDSKTVNLTDSFMKQYNNTYVQAFKLFMEYSEKGLIDTVVFWGINDDHSWLNSNGRINHPFLIGRDNELKSTYWEVISLALE